MTGSATGWRTCTTDAGTPYHLGTTVPSRDPSPGATVPNPLYALVTFMDTHAVTAVVHCANRLFAEGGRLVVYRPPASLRRIFELMWGGDSGARLFISGERGEL